MSTFAVGYIHSHSRPGIANAQLPLWTTHGWWVDRLALLTIPYYSLHWCFRDRGIDLPDEVQCSPHARVATSVMNRPCPFGVILAWWHSTRTVRRLSCLLTRSNHRFGTLVKLSAWLYSDLTRAMSTDSPYSLTRLASASTRRLISISFAALVRTLAFPVSVSVTHLCTHAESVWICNMVASHISAMFMPFSTASSSAKFMFYVSLSLCSQLAPSTTAYIMLQGHSGS